VLVKLALIVRRPLGEMVVRCFALMQILIFDAISYIESAHFFHYKSKIDMIVMIHVLVPTASFFLF